MKATDCMLKEYEKLLVRQMNTSSRAKHYAKIYCPSAWQNCITGGSCPHLAFSVVHAKNVDKNEINSHLAEDWCGSRPAIFPARIYWEDHRHWGRPCATVARRRWKLEFRALLSAGERSLRQPHRKMSRVYAARKHGANELLGKVRKSTEKVSRQRHSLWLVMEFPTQQVVDEVEF